jgi:hypothetical protein
VRIDRYNNHPLFDSSESFVPLKSPVFLEKSEHKIESERNSSLFIKAFRTKDKTESEESMNALVKKRICTNVAKLSEEQISEVLNFLNIDELSVEALFNLLEFTVKIKQEKNIK